MLLLREFRFNGIAMGMTITEKILAEHCELDSVEPGQLIEADVDLVLMNDITGAVAIDEFHKAGAKKVFNPDKIVLVNDHFAPNKDIKSAEQCKMMREFAKKYDIRHFYDVGRMGIEHALLPEQGFVHPDDLIIGADSHTCTYGALGAFSTGVGSTDAAAAMISGKCWFKVPPTIKFVYHGRRQKHVTGKDLILYTIGDIGVDGATYMAMEFLGDAIEGLPMDGRLTMCNMAIEAGGKNGIIPVDSETLRYLQLVGVNNYGEPKSSDNDADFESMLDYDVSRIEPQVACPHLPSNVKPISEMQDKKIYIDQAVIGSCTNGRIEDLRQMAGVLKGRRVADYVRLVVIPATMTVFRQGIDERIERVVTDAGGIYSTPTCGPCLGGHMGVLASGERCIATTNRNFVGRMGHPKSEVYLSNPAIAAASAIKGYICSPEVLD